MCNAYNHSLGCNCGFGGDTGDGCNWGDKWVLSKYLFRSSACEARTNKTRCWWCGELVFYHTNGYGDSVLFDELGYPWQVHACWQQYKKEKVQQRQISSVRHNLLQKTDFESLIFSEKPSSNVSVEEFAQGYIIENHVFQSDYKKHTFLNVGYPSHYIWNCLDVHDVKEKQCFKFLIPNHVAKEFHHGMIVEVAGEWIVKGKIHFLVTMEITSILFPSGDRKTKFIKIGQNESNKKTRLKKISNLTDPEERRSKALQLYKQGITISNIAQLFGVKYLNSVLIMILEAAFQLVQNQQQNINEVTVSRVLDISVEVLRRDFGCFYLLTSKGIRLAG